MTENKSSLMKFKLFILLFLAMILIFSVGSVSAAGDTIYVNDTGGNDDNDGSDWITAKKTIKNATGSVNVNGIVNIANGQYNGTNNTGITINKNMTINGQSQTGTIINGTGTNWIFNINAGINVTLNNLTLTNGNSNDYGGAIYNEGTVTVTDCAFTNNTAQYGGGAIYNNGGTVTVTDCAFTNNTAQYGGAIYNGVTLTVTDSTFTNNTATNYGGGAIYNDRTLTVTDSTFTNNTATNYGGGAIYNYGTLTADFNRIVGNLASEGGAIYHNSGSANIENNWWGSNSPVFANLLSGVSNPTQWLYMTIKADPTIINNGKTSLITVSFNNLFDGTNITPLDPATGHIPDGSPVTFNTDLGSVGSKTINKETINGTATATLTADEAAGIAHVNAVSDSQTVNTNVTIQQSIAPTAKANIKGGLFNVNKNVYLSMNKPGNIYYTRNGSTPTNASTKYTGYIFISSSTTLKFIAIDQEGNKSPVYTEKYVIDKTAPKVIYNYPKNLSTGQSRTATLYLKFSEKIKASTYWSKIYVKDLKTGKKVSITKWIKGNILYIKTNYKRASLRSYQVYVPYKAVKDFAGNNLVKTFAYKFKTRS